MATNAELSAKLDTLQTTLDQEQEQVSAAVQALKDENTALKEIIAAGGGITPADLDAHIAKVDGIITDLQSTLPDA